MKKINIWQFCGVVLPSAGENKNFVSAWQWLCTAELINNDDHNDGKQNKILSKSADYNYIILLIFLFQIS